MRQFSALAPAKVNLTLDVFPPRSDGFHDIDSVVVKLGIADILHFTIGDTEDSALLFTCDDATLPTNDDNLVVKAARHILAQLVNPPSVAIHLEKKLPSQAGLGGGSSDAATTLAALGNAFGLPQETLWTLAAEIGSDVPLFLHDGPVRMQGRGEIITPLLIEMPPIFGVVVRPNQGVPTKTAYRLMDVLPRRTSAEATPRFLSLLQSNAPFDKWADSLHNDFEEAIFPAFPEVADAYQTLLTCGTKRALLCGSGSAVLGLVETRQAVSSLYEQLRQRFPFVAAIV